MKTLEQVKKEARESFDRDDFLYKGRKKEDIERYWAHFWIGWLQTTYESERLKQDK